jgi:hypothetical protein
MKPKKPQINVDKLAEKYFEAGVSPRNDSEFNAFRYKDATVQQLNERYHKGRLQNKNEEDIALPMRGASVGRIKRGEAPVFEKGKVDPGF